MINVNFYAGQDASYLILNGYKLSLEKAKDKEIARQLTRLLIKLNYVTYKEVKYNGNNSLVMEFKGMVSFRLSPDVEKYILEQKRIENKKIRR
jgi:hypothetical protein